MYCSNTKFGELLISAGKININQLEAILFKQKSINKSIGELLEDEGLINEEDIVWVLSKQYNLQALSLNSIVIELNAINLVPEQIASKNNLIPISINENKIKIAISDPLNIFAYDDVKLVSGYDVEVYIAPKSQIKKAIAKNYSTQYAKRAVEELEKENLKDKSFNSKTAGISLSIENAPSVKLVDTIIKSAIELRASDIHIEPLKEHVRIRYRIDGELQEIVNTSIEIVQTFITRIKILSSMDIAERRLPLDGRIIMNIEGIERDLRVSSIPTIYGEKIVIRILGRNDVLLSKEKLGFQGDSLSKINRIIKNPHGIILITGPTGSGKSTTLYSFLQDLNTIEKNIITLEDPVEYLIDGITQININNKIGFGFKEGLRAILRQDPDVIMLGEIRDDDTAKIAIKAAITGHLVLSTIHTNDAPSAITRLIDMGIEPYLTAAAIIGVISQRLVRRLCLHCRVEYKANILEKRVLGIPNESNINLFKAVGCYFCNGTGYFGRIGIHEIMEITKEHRELILVNRCVDELKNLSIQQGMITIRAACKKLVLEGITSLSEYSKLSCIDE